MVVGASSTAGVGWTMDERILELAELEQLASVEKEVAKVRARVKMRAPTFDGTCVECGEAVHPQRITFGADTCFPCQTELERIERFEPQ